MLSDTEWAAPEPLSEACRLKAKTPPPDLQRTLPAILWRNQNGAKWRAILEDLGPWGRAAHIFIRWSSAAVWEWPLSLMQERGVQLGMVFLDGMNIRARQKAAGAVKRGGCGAKRDTNEALGRLRVGYGTEACIIADRQGRAIAFWLGPGQALELLHAVPLLDHQPGVPKWVVGEPWLHQSRLPRAHLKHGFAPRDPA